MARKFTPLRAIRKYCLWCCLESSDGVRLCPNQACPLWNRRSGRNPKEPDSLTPIKAIRAKCIECCGGSIHGPENCPFADCPLWPYRLGKRPKENEWKEWERKVNLINKNKG